LLSAAICTQLAIESERAENGAFGQPALAIACAIAHPPIMRPIASRMQPRASLR
jgi:hypothetical protein